MGGVARRTFQGLKSTSAVPIRVRSRMSSNELLENWYFWRVKKIQTTPTKQDLGTSYEFFSKFPTSTPVLLYRSAPSTMCISAIAASISPGTGENTRSKILVLSYKPDGLREWTFVVLSRIPGPWNLKTVWVGGCRSSYASYIQRGSRLLSPSVCANVHWK